MNVKKILLTLVSSFILSLCLSPIETLAATISDSGSEMVLTVTTSDSVPGNTMTEYPSMMVSASAIPVCDHGDPAVTLHSSMQKFLRTSIYWDPINNIYKEWAWYQCVLCGFEEKFYRYNPIVEGD